MKTNQRKYFFLASVFSAGLFLDQWSKQMILDKFKWGESIQIMNGFFNLTYVRNKGAAFGFLHSAPEAFREPFFLAIPIIALFVLGYLYYRAQPEDRLSLWALSLIICGAAGNLIDRVRLGYVVDFLDFYLNSLGHWPAFNIADSAIVVGVSLLFIQSLFLKKHP